jgi:hypothetical protein
MLMLNNRLIKLFLCITFLTSLTKTSFDNKSLISIVKKRTVNRSILLNEENKINRAFDLYIGSTSSLITSALSTSTNHNGGSVRDCAWHPSGKWLASVGTTGLAGAIYDFSERGTALYHINPQNGITYGAQLNAVAWHPSGNFLAYGGALASGIYGKVAYFNTNTGLKKDLPTSCNLTHGNTIYSLSWSLDGKYLVAAGNGPSNIDHVQTYSFDGYALWKLPNAKITVPDVPTTHITSIDWHPSGNYVALCTFDNFIYVYFFNKKSNIFTYLPTCRLNRQDNVWSVHWHPSGNYFVVGSDKDGALGPTVNTFVFEFNGLDMSIKDQAIFISNLGENESICKWSPKGDYFGAVSPTHPTAKFRLYSFLQEEINDVTTASYAPASGGFNQLSWSPDQNYIAMGGTTNPRLQVLKISEPTNLDLYTQKKELLTIKNMLKRTSALLPTLYESTLSTSALIDLTLSFSISSLTTVTSFLINGITGATQPSFDWHPNQNLIAVSNISTLYLYYYDEISLSLIHSIGASEPIVTTIPVWDTKWSPRGDFLVSGGWRVYINSFDGYNFTSLSSKYDHLFNGIEWDKSGNFVFCSEQRTTPTATVNDPGLLSAYYFDGTSLTKMTSTGDLEYSNQMSVNYNNHLVAKGGSKGKVNIYAFDPLSTDTLSFVQSLNSLSTSCSTVIFHPTQDILFVNTDTQIRAFSINGTFTTELLGCQVSAAGAQFLDFDPTGRFLLVSFFDKFIIFKFDGATLSEVIRYSSGADTLTGAKWSYDGKTIATMVDTGSTVFLRILRVNFNALTDSKPNLLQETSNAALSLNHESSLLVFQNSHAILSLNDLNNSNSTNNIQGNILTIATSNALANLLIQTSDSANTLLIPNSQAIISINNLTVANSFFIHSLSPLDIQNSNAIITEKNLTINTSNAISELLVATSNALAGLLVRTSNAMAGLLIATSQASNALTIKTLALETIDIGPSHIHFNSPTITMSYNLLLSTDHQLFVHASGVVNGNGHSITFARGAGTQMTIDPAITTTFQNVIFKDYNDASVVIGAGSSFIFGDDCRVELAEPQTLSRTWSFAGTSLLDGHNNSITLGTENNFLSTLISSSLTIANAHLLNVRNNNIRAANNNAAIIFNNAQIYLSSDFTYSIGSMVINNDVTLRGTSIFNYSTIMGLTIASQSKLTIDQGCTFNYAPAGNFRNLLSFTDSSATLFFNNASLVATATGPRLINGTLLIDGVMQIQSAASSLAEGIIFGNGIPNNDLILNVMPGGNLHLLSGFLNYANAQ